ncbi:Major facilitator superfamily [Trinorchestia longiramus]|nr:Major facilitator superfamily [Trinorchestia longiramus]
MEGDEELTREMPPLRKIDQYLSPDCPCCNISKRYTMSVLASIGFLISFGIRCNMGVAVIKMTSNLTVTGGSTANVISDLFYLVLDGGPYNFAKSLIVVHIENFRLYSCYRKLSSSGRKLVRRESGRRESGFSSLGRLARIGRGAEGNDRQVLREYTGGTAIRGRISHVGSQLAGPLWNKRYPAKRFYCVNLTSKFENFLHLKEQEIPWTDDVIGVVDSSFFWGYIVTQIPGGLIASRFPAHRVFGLAIAVSSFLNLFIPVTSRMHPVAVIIVRVMQGLVEVKGSIPLASQCLSGVVLEFIEAAPHKGSLVHIFNRVAGSTDAQQSSYKPGELSIPDGALRALFDGSEPQQQQFSKFRSYSIALKSPSGLHLTFPGLDFLVTLKSCLYQLLFFC